MNQFLEAAPGAQVAHGLAGCVLSLNDQCIRPPRPLADLAPRTLAVMHGSSYAGDGAAALKGLADAFDTAFALESGFVATRSVLVDVPA